jgi:hypothetical protein
LADDDIVKVDEVTQSPLWEAKILQKHGGFGTAAGAAEAAPAWAFLALLVSWLHKRLR